MASKSPHSKVSAALRRFCRCEDGSYTLEAVIWMPIFAILLAIIMNLSMMFFHESQMMRISQDAVRSFSLGRITEVEAEQYIIDRLAYIGANEMEIDIRLIGDPTTPIAAEALVSVVAAELMPFDLMSFPFQTINVGVVTQYLIEY